MAISLQKGQRISLEKQGQSIQRICVGVNWGAIVKKGWFGGTKQEDVDLDASCALFDEQNQLVDLVFFQHLRSACGAVQHSGDDREGDAGGEDDGLDNEVITVNLPGLPANVSTIVFVLNSFLEQDFKDIPYAHIRLYEGTPERVDSEFAKLDVANDPAFNGKVCMVMGKFYKKDGTWKFQAIGEPTSDRNLEGLLNTVVRSYLN